MTLAAGDRSMRECDVVMVESYYTGRDAAREQRGCAAQMTQMPGTTKFLFPSPRA